MNTSRFQHGNNLATLKKRKYNNGELDGNGVWVTVHNGKLKFNFIDMEPRCIDGKEWIKIRYEDFQILKSGGQRKESRKLVDKQTGIIYYAANNDRESNNSKLILFQDKNLATQANPNPSHKVRQRLMDFRQNSHLNANTAEWDVGTYENLTKHYQEPNANPEHGFNADHVLALKQLGEYCKNIRRALHVPSGDIVQLNDPAVLNSMQNQVNALFGHPIHLTQDNIVSFALKHSDDLLQEMSGNHSSRLAKRAITIAINDANYHRKFSATYGGRQSKKDRIGADAEVKRLVLDGNLDITPTAIHRDIKSVYQGIAGRLTTNIDHLSGHEISDNHLNLTKSLGAYRRLYRENIKDGVFNISKDAYSYKQDPLQKGGLVYTPKIDPTGIRVSASNKTDKFMIKRINNLCGMNKDLGLDCLFV